MISLEDYRKLPEDRTVDRAVYWAVDWDVSVRWDVNRAVSVRRAVSLAVSQAFERGFQND